MLSRRERSSYVLATKLTSRCRAVTGALTGPGRETDRGFTQAAETDYVDLYQCHRYDENTPLDETMEALSDVVRAGRARYLGFSEWSAGQIQASLDLPDVVSVSSQPQYSILRRSQSAT